MNKNLKNFLEFKAYKLRYLSIISTSQAGSGHPTSCLSAADIMSVLFFYSMHFDPKNSTNPNNDRFILSKGHASPVLYAVWEEIGVLKEEDLLTLRQFDSVLEGHPTPRFDRIEAATGSLGQGLSVGLGIALSAKLDKRNFKTYVLLGDSEVSEGQIWEAIQLASHYKFNNLIAILDMNRLGQANETMEGWNLKDYEKKFKAFGWKTIIVDGHNILKIAKALDSCKNSKTPSIIIAKTVKGHGIKSVENKNGYHGKAFKLDELSNILNELNNRFPKQAKYENDFKWKPKIPKYKNEKIKSEKIKLPNPKYKIGEKIKTRKAYGESLAVLGDYCPQLLSLDGEVKNSTYSEILEKKYPKKFIECFIAEQNMVSMAVGLTSRNKICFVSTFSSFLSRAFDQLRMAAISRSSLRVCGSHCGVSIGQDGPSQMGLEDIAMMRTLPESVVLYPSDAVSTYRLVEQMANYNDGISYLRTTRSETKVIYPKNEKFEIGGCKVLHQSNNDVCCVIGAGITLLEALKAYEELKKEEILISVIDLYSIKPIDTETIFEVAKKSKSKIITVEDHYLQGGLGEAVSFELKNSGVEIQCLAVNKLPHSGKPEELARFENIDANAIINHVKILI